jgi:phage shock protein C
MIPILIVQRSEWRKPPVKGNLARLLLYECQQQDDYRNAIMTTASIKPVFFGREDTMLGICESVGQDFGFNPNYLRVAFGGLLVLNPAVVIASYFALGLLVFASRVIVGNPVATQTGDADVVTLTPRAATPETVEPEYALAA